MGKGTLDTEKCCAVLRGIKLGVFTQVMVEVINSIFTSCLYTDESAVAGPKIYITTPIMPRSLKKKNKNHHLKKLISPFMIVAFNYTFVYPHAFTGFIQENKTKGCLKQKTQAYVTKEHFLL